MKKHSFDQSLKIKRMHILTYDEPVVYLHQDSLICRSEGLASRRRIQICCEGHRIIATLHFIDNHTLAEDEIGLSEHAWELLQPKPDSEICISHPPLLDSVKYIRRKIYNHELDQAMMECIMTDIMAGRVSDVQISSFLTACAGGALSHQEILALTEAMLASGRRIQWPFDLVVDKHCIGGLPGNRTSPIIVAIVSACGLIMPKTSSRSITSPAGTADTMEVLTHVELNIEQMQQVVEKEGGCLVWGGSVDLSPVDDMLIRIERALDLDSEGQLIASILSKKLAAGSTHVLIDLPFGPTAKIRDQHTADFLRNSLITIGAQLGLQIEVIQTDGVEPIGQGVGPALEARDVLAVLANDAHAPQDLKEKSIKLAGAVIEYSPDVAKGKGAQLARQCLESGQAMNKLIAICQAQGGFFEIPTAQYQKVITSNVKGKITAFHNRLIAKIAKLAGAPMAKTAGIEVLVKMGETLSPGQPILRLHAETKSQLEYAASLLEDNQPLRVEES